VNEIKILKLIDHPGIVALRGHAQDYTSVLLEYMPNDTFLKILKKGPFHINLGKTIAAYLVNVLSKLHELSIAHCDIKPENILIAADYNVKLCDFGFSRITNSL
jgi:serine/threonine protein kinase